MPIREIKTAGGTLAVEIDGSGPLIICSPGMGDTRDAYAPLSAQLVKAGYTVARMDPRGHGDSSVDFESYGDLAAADDFITVASELNLGPAVLAGASFSAGGAVIAAGKRPELVSGLVLLGPFLRNGMGAVGTALMPTLFYKPWGPFVWQTYAKTLWPGLGDKAGERAAQSKQSLSRPGRWAAFQATVAGANHSVVAPYLDKVKVPVLVLMGDKDPDWSDPLKEAEWVASNFGDVENVAVAGCGHAPQLESPDFVGEKVLSYLGRVKSKGGFTATAAA